ncbi:MAG TPA: phospho-N-acetylmuramoyl-pentapeptide-transferase [Thermoanaerobaculia bacterium]|nr:phospho-N-acetylmuramoyl-pentapeptide-transferase [Thermoanaerobaculia bacterium]
MLYHLLFPLRELWSVFNVFQYLTFRSALAGATAVALSLMLGPATIRWLRRLSVGQSIREEGPERHREKAGTPTMGGVLIVAAVALPTLMWANLTNHYVWVTLLALLGFGAIGFVDDFLKVRRRRNLGLTARAKMGLQLVVSAAVGGTLLLLPGHQEVLLFPFFKNLVLPLGLLYLPFVMLVLVGASNAVNLTDGLDGLAIGATLIAAGTYALLSYIAGHAVVADYLQVAHVPGAGEVAIVCAAMVGASIGFLWFNAHPAEMFMGDVGSLALGGGIGTVAVVAKQELLLVVVGGLFVAEALSVIVQVASYRFRGRRVLRMAPVHHHFELVGWSETKIVVRFWIVAILFSFLALSTLKLR